MLYNHAEISCSELPIYKEKNESMYFFEELDKKYLYVKSGFLLIDENHKLYKPLYRYN